MRQQDRAGLGTSQVNIKRERDMNRYRNLRSQWHGVPPTPAIASLCLLLGLLPSRDLAAAEDNAVACPAAAAPYRFLRQNEDFGFLRDPACRSDLFDPIKYIPLGPGGEQFLTFGGDLRLQTISARYLSFGTEGGDNHNVAIERLHLHSSLRLSPNLRGFAELKSNHQQNREPGPLAVDVDDLDVHQLFVDIGNERSNLLRLGRQELLYGSGRRIFPRNGPNVRGNFDAALWVQRIADWRVDSFAFRPVGVSPGTFDDKTLRNQSYWGIYGVGAPNLLSPLGLDLYYLGAQRQTARFSQGVAPEHRHSLGSRLFGKRGAWDFDHELTLQWGSFGSASIRAWSMTGETGYSWPLVAGRPRASFRYTYGSGDADPNDKRLGTFNALFPRGGVVTEDFNQGPANLRHARLALAVDLAPSLRATGAYETHWRSSLRDGVYGQPGNIYLQPGSSQARHIGDSLGGILDWQVDKHFNLNLAMGYMFRGQFVDERGAGRDQRYVKTTFSYRF